MKSNNKGFTLVEILAVLSVLGVVSILIIPTMLKAFYDTRSLLS